MAEGSKDTNSPNLSATVSGAPNDISKTEVVLDTGFKKVGERVAPAVQAKAALVADLETGETYYELNPEVRWPLASITKLVSVVVATDFLDEEQEVVVTQEDFDLETNNHILEPGGRYKVKDLLRAMLLNSSNEAAEAVAKFHGRDDFVEAMNVKAERWGLGNTNFDDPTGISVSNQSTLYDLEKVVRAIYKLYPEIFETTTRDGWTIYNNNSDTFSRVVTTNNFVGWNDFLGGKTGYTDEALGNLVSLFSYEGRPVLIIVFGTLDRFGDTRLLYDWFKRNYRLTNNL